MNTNIEKLYRKNNKHYAVYLIQGERWQYPLSEKIIFRTFTRVWKGKNNMSKELEALRKT